VGASQAALKTEKGLLFDDYAKDAVGWIELLRKTKGVEAIFVAGHSEGSLIGMLAVQKTRVRGYISIAGPARSADEIIVEQLGNMAPQLKSMADSLLKRLRKGEIVDSVPPNLYFLLRPNIQPYLKNWIGYTPCAELKKLKIPTLIIQGTTDIQVAPGEAEQLAICQPKASLKIIEGMNHVLKTAGNDLKENKATYTNPILPLSGQLIETISTFVRENS
jgi:pimeloyl-ACP methyl ester carboxylesterase